MFSHPSITAAVADQHRRDLIAQADAYRLAHAARHGSGGRPVLSRPVLTTRRLVTAAVGCAAAVVVTLAPPAGAAHPSAHVFAHHFVRTAAAQVKWA